MAGAKENADNGRGECARISGCPYLPQVDGILTAESMRPHRGRRGPEFYLAALEYGQSLWMQGKPAQAILQLNKAWMARLDGSEEVLRRWPNPYRALCWMLENVPHGSFIGNPVRHFQHLASRVQGEQVELRSWRAWACFHLSQAVLPPQEYPPDEIQIQKDSLAIPELEEVLIGLSRCGWLGEDERVREVMREAQGNR